MKVAIRDTDGKQVGEMELKEELFGVEPNPHAVHQVVRMQRAAERSGTSSTRTRSEVRGGGAKPWRQKGTGRARAGSIRSPLWKGGGVVFGPKPKDYRIRVPKKVRRLAFRSVLSQAAKDRRVLVLEDFTLERPSTKVGNEVISKLGREGRTMLILSADDVNVYKSFRNLPDVEVYTPGELNTYDMLRFDRLLFLRGALESLQGGGSDENPS